MKLSDICNMPLNDIVAKLELSNMQIHSDDNGNICSIELKYTEPKDTKVTKTTQW